MIRLGAADVEFIKLRLWAVAEIHFAIFSPVCSIDSAVATHLNGMVSAL